MSSIERTPANVGDSPWYIKFVIAEQSVALVCAVLVTFYTVVQIITRLSRRRDPLLISPRSGFPHAILILNGLILTGTIFVTIGLSLALTKSVLDIQLEYMRSTPTDLLAPTGGYNEEEERAYIDLWHRLDEISFTTEWFDVGVIIVLLSTLIVVKRLYLRAALSSSKSAISYATDGWMILCLMVFGLTAWGLTIDV